MNLKAKKKKQYTDVWHPPMKTLKDCRIESNYDIKEKYLRMVLILIGTKIFMVVLLKSNIKSSSRFPTPKKAWEKNLYLKRNQYLKVWPINGNFKQQWSIKYKRSGPECNAYGNAKIYIRVMQFSMCTRRELFLKHNFALNLNQESGARNLVAFTN